MQFKEGRKHERRGAALVEMAVVAPLLMLFVLGIIEVGRVVMVQQILTNASREGARRAVIESATDIEVQSLVSAYLSNTSVAGATVTVTPSPLSSAGFGDSVTVSVSVPFSSVNWLGSSWFFQNRTLTASSLMRAERLQ
jgi:Flp pilus assembly protein TadG